MLRSILEFYVAAMITIFIVLIRAVTFDKDIDPMGLIIVAVIMSSAIVIVRRISENM